MDDQGRAVSGATRELMLPGLVQWHQMRSYLDALGVEWERVDRAVWDPGRLTPRAEFGIFRITATPEQWRAIDEYAEKVQS